MRNYKQLYTLINQHPALHQYNNAEELKKELVYSISKGRTESVKALTIREYKELINYLKNAKQITSNGEMDKLRKRVIASIFGFFEIVNKQVNIGYVKAIAVRASGKGIDDFNKIPKTKLQAIYNLFLRYQEVAKNLSKEEAILQLDARILALAGIEVKVKCNKAKC